MRTVCLIGCGRIGSLHARHLAGRARVVCYDRAPERAARLAAAHRLEVVPTWDQVLRRQDVEALLLCSPPEFHSDQAVAGLQAGKSVLVEKPVCVRLEEADRLAAAAAGVLPGRLMVAENYYYKPVLTLLRRLIRTGVVGVPAHLHLRKLSWQQATGWKQGYGALLEGGIHFVALVSALAESCGYEGPERVRAEFPGQPAGQPERRSHTFLQYSGALDARIDYGWDRQALLGGLFQHSQLRGTEGRVVFESNGLYAAAARRGQPRLYWPGLRDLMGYRAMTDDFLACLEEPTRAPVSSLRRARRDLEIVLAAYGGA
jgi:predicted dehydrogenase